MAYSEELKKQIKERLAKEERVKGISEQTGISMATLYKWKREMKQQEGKQEEREMERKQEKIRENPIQESEEKTEEKAINSFKERIKVELNPEVMIGLSKREKGRFYEVIEFLKEKRKDVYVGMQSQNSRVQRKSIAQWDKIEGLIENVKMNRNNKEYLDILYHKITELKQLEKEWNR